VKQHEALKFFRTKNARRKLVTDPEQRRRNKMMGQLLSLGLFEGGRKKPGSRRLGRTSDQASKTEGTTEPDRPSQTVHATRARNHRATPTPPSVSLPEAS